ncbi:hypothetical protein ACFVYD_35695 [Streptomyces sp. NPDC058301]|uniref:hypothetical protein n=1 Tax=Streptomyces sp. NPDC058301 TaxID=3346436 RepID=UPI0036EB52E2
MPVPAPPLAEDAGPPTPPGGSRRVAYAPLGPGAPAPAGGPPGGEGGTEGGAHGARTPATGAEDCAGEVVRWAAFSCVLVPVVLVVYGSSFAGAAGSALGLAAVTAVCRLMLRQSERAARAVRVARTADRPGPGRHRRRRANGASSPLG